MTINEHESTWKLVVGALFLLSSSSWASHTSSTLTIFLERSGIRKGGRMLTQVNREGIRIAGLLLAIFAAGVLYDILRN